MKKPFCYLLLIFSLNLQFFAEEETAGAEPAKLHEITVDSSPLPKTLDEMGTASTTLLPLPYSPPSSLTSSGFSGLQPKLPCHFPFPPRTKLSVQIQIPKTVLRRSLLFGYEKFSASHICRTSTSIIEKIPKGVADISDQLRRKAFCMVLNIGRGGQRIRTKLRTKEEYKAKAGKKGVTRSRTRSFSRTKYIKLRLQKRLISL